MFFLAFFARIYPWATDKRRYLCSVQKGRLERPLRFETLEDRRLLAVCPTLADYSESAMFADSLQTSGNTDPMIVVSAVPNIASAVPGAVCTLTVKYRAENTDNNSKLYGYTLRIYFHSDSIQMVSKTEYNELTRGFTSLGENLVQDTLPSITVSDFKRSPQSVTLNYGVKSPDDSDGFATIINYYVECSWFHPTSSCLPLASSDTPLLKLQLTLKSAEDIPYAESVPFYLTGDITSPSPSSWSTPNATTTISIIGKLPPINLTLTKSPNGRCDQATVSWNAVEGATGYKLEYWRSGNYGNPTTAVDDTADTEYLVTDLLPGTTYYFRMTAKSVHGNDFNSTSPQSSVQTDAVVYNLCAQTAGTLSAESVGPNDPFTINDFTVQNLGNYASGEYSVSFYASTDNEITPDDTLLGTPLNCTSIDFDKFATLNSGEFSLSDESLAPGMAYYIGWIINKTDDSDSTNNTTRLERQLYKKLTLTGVTISGTVEVGQTLTANITPQDATATYQWYRGETAISNATNSSYTLTIADADHTIHVTATGTDDYTGSVTSAATVPVERASHCFAQDVYTVSPFGDIYITVHRPDNSLTYQFDLDGDGDYEKSVERGFDTLGFYVNASQRSAGDEYAIRVWTIDSQNHLSASVDAQVQIIFSPTLTVSRSWRQNGQILLLNLGITGSRTITSWSIDWGDGTPQGYNQISNQLSAIHYYNAPLAQTDVMLTVTDCLDETYSFVAARHSAPIPAQFDTSNFSLAESAVKNLGPAVERAERIEAAEDAAIFTPFNQRANQNLPVRSTGANRSEELAPADCAGKISANALDTVFDDFAVALWEPDLLDADSIAAANWIQSFWDGEKGSPDTSVLSDVNDPLAAAFDIWQRGE